MADGIVNDGSVDLEFCTCISFYFCTEAAQEFCQYGDVGQIRVPLIMDLPVPGW